jgi:hypothetical protein
VKHFSIKTSDLESPNIRFFGGKELINLIESQNRPEKMIIGNPISTVLCSLEVDRSLERSIVALHSCLDLQAPNLARGLNSNVMMRQRVIAKHSIIKILLNYVLSRVQDIGGKSLMNQRA